MMIRLTGISMVYAVIMGFQMIVPLQIAQVQVSTELLEVSGMDSKDSFPRPTTVLPLVRLT